MTKVNERGESLEEFLRNYNANSYPKAAITTDAVLFDVEEQPQILLIKRKNHPCIGQWALPGGFLDVEEGLYQGVQRELAEETHVRAQLEQFYTFGDDPKRDKRDRVLTVAYTAFIKKDKVQIKADDDALDAKWFNIFRTEDIETIKNSYGQTELHRVTHYSFVSIDRSVSIIFDLHLTLVLDKMIQLSKRIEVVHKAGQESLAFDHGEIIDNALSYHMKKIEAEPLALSILDEPFSMCALQKVYEGIQNKDYSKAEFCSKLLGKGFLKKVDGGYAFDESWNLLNRR